MAKKQAVNGERGRWSAKAKREAVLRLLRGEAIDALSRELKVTAAKLSEWREAFLAGGATGHSCWYLRESTYQTAEGLRHDIDALIDPAL